ncbi:hypothetical protein ACP93_05320 [Xanthomonas sp. NCPPB 1128]|uniref:DUF5691 domain-containing protein n=1 Tax=Xanthomonas sp. NCPPB 1128 TaxID=1775876 RepID=UPI00065ABF1B|nr:DUF5691 domain-containing protein [Xanthomonas sp. NCPPB 1128]KMM76519.1 hypothetical protein ACP93_05320 [Xanthomonas sp. NCPPB 1128]
MNEAWLKPALLGIDRPQRIPVDGALGEVLAAIAMQEDAALGYSLQVGALAACRRAALRLGAALPSPPPVSPDPQVLPADHPWLPLLQALFAGQQPPAWLKRLRQEACLQLATRGQNLPVAVLPQALDAGARLAALRSALRAVLGARGHWLAARNAEWAYAADAVEAAHTPADLERMWSDGAFDTRLLALRQLRAQDAAGARVRVEAALKELSARERAACIEALQAHLSEADAPLLQQLLKDRSREVRLLVGPMLARLSSTAHAQYLQTQMLGVLRQQRTGLLRRVTWTLDAPSAIDAGWNDTAIDAKRPDHDALGERAWWLYQLARQLPLAWWSNTLEKNPEVLLAWVRSTEWYDALLRAWLERVDASEPAWVEALIGVEQRLLALGELLALLPPAQRERHWPASAADLQQQRLLGDVLASTALGETLSAAYSQRLAAGLGALFEAETLRHDYILRDALLELLAILHPAALPQVQVADPPADATAAMLDCVQQARQLLALRQTLHAAS